MATNPRKLQKETGSVVDRIMHDIEHANEHIDAQISQLQHRVAIYERIYGLPSQEMRAKIGAGEIVENYDICEWLIDLELLEHVTSTRRG